MPFITLEEEKRKRKVGGWVREREITVRNKRIGRGLKNRWEKKGEEKTGKKACEGVINPIMIDYFFSHLFMNFKKVHECCNQSYT